LSAGGPKVGSFTWKGPDTTVQYSLITSGYEPVRALDHPSTKTCRHDGSIASFQQVISGINGHAGLAASALQQQPSPWWQTSVRRNLRSAVTPSSRMPGETTRQENTFAIHIITRTALAIILAVVSFVVVATAVSADPWLVYVRL